MNSSRHANRATRGERPGRAQGRGGRQRGGFNDRASFNTGSSSVPSVQQVVNGAFVSIVLKIDQPTGRQVQGTVAELLTRGNHPRGIKVRLQDGRVGRVQRMATEDEARIGSAGLSGLGRNGEQSEGAREIAGMGSMQSSMMGHQDTRPTASKYGYYRLDEPDQPPTSELSLEDYIVTKSSKKSRRGKNTSDSEPIDQSQVSASRDLSTHEPVTTACPVCGEFEGDEMAVAHHVNGHFE
ncbi:hypothetical protein VTL71DRAFT_11180 [Oculimacula yallundae]|uniref:Uncharacterized protein n=1 Tax=Oculimacula yallundae TaxID=86028 RepID=A0ABR4CV91_9HELO